MWLFISGCKTRISFMCCQNLNRESKVKSMVSLGCKVIFREIH